MVEHITQMIITILSLRLINMPDLNEVVTKIGSPWVVKTIMGENDFLNSLLVGDVNEFDCGLFMFDARKMHSYSSFYDEMCEVMHFPDYFGRNLNALGECLSDLDWLGCDRYIIYIANADELLIQENEDDVEKLVELFEKIAQEWSNPVSLGEAWDRDAIPFHVILQITKKTNLKLDSVE